MRLSLRLPLLFCLLTGFTFCVTDAHAGGIEAVKGKAYHLGEQHGPWMIMVASLRDREENKNRAGMTAQEAADELVYELRKKGIPAYSFTQDRIKTGIGTKDRLGRNVNRSYYAQQGRVCVLAGNYKHPEDKVAQKTLKYIKKELKPKFLMSSKSGAIFRATPGKPGPLSGAFLTVNPRLSPEDAKRRSRDPLLLKLNAGIDHSLMKNPGKYTLVIATFTGKTLTVDPRRYQSAQKNFKVNNSLDDAAMNAWQLAQRMRDLKTPVETYVFHDRYKSVVTIGSFDDPQDPRIKALSQKYGAKYLVVNGRRTLTAEMVHLPGATPNSPPVKTWVLDPSPVLLEVPKW